MKKIIKILITLITLIIFITGCTNSEDTGTVYTEGPPQVKLTITKNYGREIIFQEEIEIKENYTVYDVLNDNVDLGTDYGGGFVSSINGIESSFGGPTGIKKDWFYFINGVCADVGAIDYELSHKDEIWWDYHQWEGMNSANSSVIGLFPEPFINGYRNKNDSVTILSSNEQEKEIEDLKNYLKEKEVEKVKIEALEESFINDRQSPTILIGEWSEIKDIKYIKNLNENYKKTGTYIYYNDEKLELMNNKNESVKILENNFSTITSYGEGLGDENPLWIVTASDKENLTKVLKTLTENHKEIYLSYSIALTEEGLIKLPLE